MIQDFCIQAPDKEGIFSPEWKEFISYMNKNHGKHWTGGADGAYYAFKDGYADCNMFLDNGPSQNLISLQEWKASLKQEDYSIY